MRNLVDQARKAGILPPKEPESVASMDLIEALIVMRNDLSHGSAAIHTPAMTLTILDSCAYWIDYVLVGENGADQRGVISTETS